MKLLKKDFKIQLPAEEKFIDIAKSWLVTWQSLAMTHEYSIYAAREENHEVFLSEENAKDFKTSLMKANKLIRNRTNFYVKITENTHNS